MNPATPARTYRSVATRLTPGPAAATAMFLLLLSALAVLAVAPAAATEPGDEPATVDGQLADAIPDVVIALPSGQEPGAMVSDLEAVTGVSWVAPEAAGSEDGPTRLLVGFEAPAGDDPLEAVEAVVAEQPGGADIALAGRAVVDRALQDRIGRGVVAGVVLATLAAAGVVALLAGWARGAVAGSTIALAGWLGATLGGMAAGPFDGSVATTPVAAALAAIVTAGCLVLRLVTWYESPEGDDQADMIRRSVASLGAELILFFSGLVVVAVFLEWIGPSRSVATVVLAGALTATLLTLAIVPLALAGLHGVGTAAATGDPAGPDPESDAAASLSGADDHRALPFTVPSGRDFPVAVLIVFGCLLACMGLFAFQATSRSQVLDERALGDADSRSALAQQLAADGDPTSAVLAAFPAGTDQQAKTAWLERVSQLTSVSRIDTPVGRFDGGELVPVEGGTTGQSASAQDAEAPRYALVVLHGSGRSAEAQDLVEAIRATNAPVNAELSGAPVDAVGASATDALIVWATILSLAAVAGVAVFTLLGDVVLAVLAAGLRILGSAAVVGVYQLLVGDATGAELQVVILVVALGMSLFELGFLRRLLLSHRVENTDELLERSLGREGRAAAIGLALVAIASVGMAFTSVGLVRRLAIVLVVGIVIELVIGGWLLRPGLLGSRAISHFAAQPVRSALRALAGGGAGEGDGEAWIGVVDYLLHAEFSFQTDAGSADLDAVYMPATALHRQATEHQASLISAGLRIVGRSPQLRSIRVVSGRDPVTLAVTVDHPIRQLVDRNGKIVGVRKPERRSVMLWLTAVADGSFRIGDSVELGAMPLSLGSEPMTEVAPALGVSLE